MSASTRKLRQQLKVLKRRTNALVGDEKERLFNGKRLEEYRDDPQGYAKHVLKLKPGLTEDQLALCRLIVTPPYRVLCGAGHVVGKSFASAFIVSWLFDTRPQCYIITTAPKLESVRDIIWRELRRLRMRANLGGFTGPRSLRLETSPSHIAVGVTAVKDTAFQGKHEVSVFIVIDEAVGVEAEFWEAIETMLSGEEYGLLAIYNPTTTACQAFQEERNGNCHIHRISSLSHPNIAAELAGKPPPYPAAVRLSTVNNWIEKWCDPLDERDTKKDNDFEFPPGSGKWFHPGPIFEARALGRWPIQGSNVVWNAALFDRCCENRLEINGSWLTVIGCDVARYGDDFTEFMVRRGPCVVYHETRSGWNNSQIAGRLKQLCNQYKGPQLPHHVQVYIDETGGLGAGVVDLALDGERVFNFIGVNVCRRAMDEEQYFGLRTELWHRTVELARGGMVDLTRLSSDTKEELRSQVLAQKYVIRPNGQLWCLDKDKTKEELKRSPDTADALNLCFLSNYQVADKSKVTV